MVLQKSSHVWASISRPLSASVWSTSTNAMSLLASSKDPNCVAFNPTTLVYSKLIWNSELGNGPTTIPSVQQSFHFQ
jgi:hypothetical protein